MGCFYLLAIAHNGAMNPDVHVSIWVPAFNSSANVANGQSIGQPSSRTTTNNIKQGRIANKPTEEIKWKAKEILY